VRVLVVNAGSSSLKLTLLGDGDEILASSELGIHQGRFDTGELDRALRAALGQADVVGHRIVHGGERFRSAVRIVPDVVRAIRALGELAPLHQPRSLEALDAVSERLPDVPAVACFDTAFHATLPAAASTYALPARWRERLGVRRYGFHGLSHSWVARRTAALLERDARELRIVSCHLGAGASLCAIEGGRSVDTTMGFTPLEGLVMATRSGTVDPGLLLWLADHERVPVEELARALEHESGLLALAGSSDMRAVLDRAAEGEAASRLALDVYVHRLRGSIAAMAASLQGLDALAFTGGVGERSAEIRSMAAAGLGFLGVSLDPHANRDAAGDADLSAAGARVRTLAIAAREDLEIARQTRAVLDR
jgi:acetate kinase